MKEILIFLCVTGSLLNAKAEMMSLPNDTGTHLVSKGSDCSVIDVSDIYITQFGGQGGAGSALVIKASIDNTAYDKQIYVKINSRSEEAIISNTWWQNPTSAFYDENSSHRDLVTIVDQRVGLDRTFSLDIYVVMAGSTYSCSNIVVGEN